MTPGDAPSTVNVANALTVLRLLLVPAFLAALLVDDGASDAWRAAAAAIFVIASVTDFVDGDYARRNNQVTAFGQVADPIADKALTGAAFIGLSLLGELPWWVTVLVLVREVGVTLLRFWVIRDGIIPASRGGKVKTALQIAAILLYLLPLSAPVLLDVRVWVMAAAVVVTIATGFDYVARALRLRGASRRSAVT